MFQVETTHKNCKPKIQKRNIMDSFKTSSTQNLENTQQRSYHQAGNSENMMNMPPQGYHPPLYAVNPINMLMQQYHYPQITMNVPPQGYYNPELYPPNLMVLMQGYPYQEGNIEPNIGNHMLPQSQQNTELYPLNPMNMPMQGYHYQTENIQNTMNIPPQGYYNAPNSMNMQMQGYDYQGGSAFQNYEEPNNGNNMLHESQQNNNSVQNINSPVHKSYLATAYIPMDVYDREKIELKRRHELKEAQRCIPPRIETAILPQYANFTKGELVEVVMEPRKKVPTIVTAVTEETPKKGEGTIVEVLNPQYANTVKGKFATAVVKSDTKINKLLMIDTKCKRKNDGKPPFWS